MPASSEEAGYPHELESHLKWLKEARVSGFSGTSTAHFIPEKALSERFGRDDILDALLNEQKVSLQLAAEIADGYKAIFAVLLVIRRPAYIQHFIENDYDDTKLPFLSRKLFPNSVDFFDDFRREQWAYCVKPLKGGYPKIFPREAILPFEKDSFVAVGATSEVFTIRCHPQYDSTVCAAVWQRRTSAYSSAEAPRAESPQDLPSS